MSIAIGGPPDPKPDAGADIVAGLKYIVSGENPAIKSGFTLYACFAGAYICGRSPPVISRPPTLSIAALISPPIKYPVGPPPAE